MTNIKHFEHLWEKCEEYHSSSNQNDTSDALIEELIAKINLYQAIVSRKMPPEDLEKIKSHAFGEILLTLTNLSLKENVNVFEALLNSLKERQ